MSEGSRFLRRAIVVVSDFYEPEPEFSNAPPSVDGPVAPGGVTGGYLERLPLAAVAAGLVETAEIWHHHGGDGVSTITTADGLVRRAFPVPCPPPFRSAAMLDFLERNGAPAILVVLGLGIGEEILEASSQSIVIYNSIDVPALRVDAAISRHFDLVLTGAEWQSADVRARHPDMQAVVLPVGPEFASPETFFPLPDVEKRYDVAYVAAAQAYKRHDVLFDALARAPRPLSALCVFGYGEDAPKLREEAAARGLDVTFVGPPGVPHAEVNRLMNAARVGVVCGVDDGAPAILTEYMLAGLPVVANEGLRCGLQYIGPRTGIAAPEDRFEHAIIEALESTRFDPRAEVLRRWTWPHSIETLSRLIAPIAAARAGRQAFPQPA